MSSRPSNHLSIDVTVAASARRTLPSPMSSSTSSPPCPPEEEMISTATLSHPPTLSIPSVPYPSNSHYSQQASLQQLQQQQQQQQQRQRYRSLSGGGGPYSAQQSGSWGGPEPSMSRRPSLPVNHHQHQQMNNPYAQQGYHNSHQSSYSQQQQQLMMREQQQHHHQQHQQPPLTPSTPSSSAPVVVRHPLWKLECASCKTTLCEQAMQGHLVGDPSKKLFSTNLALGVLGLPDRPVSIICPCKFHLFACASCGSVCGYNLSQPCSGCETNRGNGHFWIFYAHEIIPHWRTIGDRNMFWDDLPTWSNKTTDGNVGR
ncbi:Protein fam72a [Linnemannia schmuckeri]|uniref:Protein fam72a n=1 Tax=Linnemannia schmuckeri TaxID=64567 RepID=A0A9P5S2F0_9FUNG|nr:Protein fam72a [Linnemannia schmuckeri]